MGGFFFYAVLQLPGHPDAAPPRSDAAALESEQCTRGSPMTKHLFFIFLLYYYSYYSIFKLQFTVKFSAQHVLVDRGGHFLVGT